MSKEVDIRWLQRFANYKKALSQLEYNSYLNISGDRGH